MRRSVLEIGDGVLQATKYLKSSKVGFLLQWLGLPRTQPSNLGRLEYFNSSYFEEGSNARQVLKKRGYDFVFAERKRSA